MRVMHSILMFFIVFILNSLVLERFLPAGSWLIAVGIAVLYPLGVMVEEKYASKFTSWLYRLGAAWFESVAILVMLVILAFAVELAGFGFAELNTVVVVVWGVLVALGLLYARTWKVTEITIPTSKVSKPFSLVQITDVHAFGAYAREWIADALQRARSLRPDVIVMTGDIIDLPSRPSSDVLKVTSSIPILYTLGNHELYVGYKEVLQRITQGPIHLLENTARMVKGINFIGVSDSSKYNALHKVPNLVNSKTFNVLLFHRPKGMKSAVKAGVDLMLSGHTHGGVHFPMHMFVAAAYGRFYRGLHKIKNMVLYTSNGSGTYNWPLRLFSPQEIVKVTLVPE